MIHLACTHIKIVSLFHRLDVSWNVDYRNSSSRCNTISCLRATSDCWVYSGRDLSESSWHSYSGIHKHTSVCVNSNTAESMSIQVPQTDSSSIATAALLRAQIDAFFNSRGSLDSVNFSDEEYHSIHQRVIQDSQGSTSKARRELGEPCRRDSGL